MSASEKLKALLHAAETDTHGWDNDIHGEPLLAALPQIVAVVEQAEQTTGQWNGEMRKRLAALEEALS